MKNRISGTNNNNINNNSIKIIIKRTVNNPAGYDWRPSCSEHVLVHVSFTVT